jgi:hypothetical protein
MTTHDDEMIRILADMAATLAEMADILRKIERALPNPLDRRG